MKMELYLKFAKIMIFEFNLALYFSLDEIMN